MQGRPIIPKRLAATFATSAVLAAALATAALAQEKVLRIGMTAADIPKTHGQPDQGFEGNRFTGIPLYDALTHWDLSSADKPSVLIPGLATEWKVVGRRQDQVDVQAAPGREVPRRLRPEGRRHRLERARRCSTRRRRTSRPTRSASPSAACRTLVSAQAIDDLTVELTTKEPDSFLPINLTNLFIASPAHWQKKYDALALGRRQGRAGQAGLGRLRCRRLGLRARSRWRSSAARARRVRQERRLLGPQAPAEDRPRRAAADAGGQRPHGGAALGPGRLDRDPGARCRPQIKSKGFVIYHERAAARVAVAVLVCRGLALARQARAPRRQPVRQSRRAEGGARRPDGGAEGHRAARAIRGGAIRSSTSSTISPPPRS